MHCVKLKKHLNRSQVILQRKRFFKSNVANIRANKRFDEIIARNVDKVIDKTSFVGHSNPSRRSHEKQCVFDLSTVYQQYCKPPMSDLDLQRYLYLNIEKNLMVKCLMIVELKETNQVFTIEETGKEWFVARYNLKKTLVEKHIVYKQKSWINRLELSRGGDDSIFLIRHVGRRKEWLIFNMNLCTFECIEKAEEKDGQEVFESSDFEVNRERWNDKLLIELKDKTLFTNEMPILLLTYGCYGEKMEYLLKELPTTLQQLLKCGWQILLLDFDDDRDKDNVVNGIIDVSKQLKKKNNSLIAFSWSAGAFLLCTAAAQRPDLFRALVLHQPHLNISYGVKRDVMEKEEWLLSNYQFAQTIELNNVFQNKFPPTFMSIAEYDELAVGGEVFMQHLFQQNNDNESIARLNKNATHYWSAKKSGLYDFEWMLWLNHMKM